LSHACEILGFGQLTGEGGLLRQPVLAQIIEPASELDSLRAARDGVRPPSYRTLRRRVPIFATGAPPSRATG